MASFLWEETQTFVFGLFCLSCCDKISHTVWLINSKNLFLTVLDAEKSKVEVLADSSVSGEDQLPTS